MNKKQKASLAQKQKALDQEYLNQQMTLAYDLVLNHGLREQVFDDADASLLIDALELIHQHGERRDQIVHLLNTAPAFGAKAIAARLQLARDCQPPEGGSQESEVGSRKSETFELDDDALAESACAAVAHAGNRARANLPAVAAELAATARCDCPDRRAVALAASIRVLIQWAAGASTSSSSSSSPFVPQPRAALPLTAEERRLAFTAAEQLKQHLAATATPEELRAWFKA